MSAEEIGAADVKAAQARLVEAKLNLEYTRVEAPISGIDAGNPLRGHARLGPECAPYERGADRPDVGELRHRRQRAGAHPEGRAGRDLKLPRNFEVELRLADGSVYPQKGKLDFADVRVSTQTGTRERAPKCLTPTVTSAPGSSYASS